MTGLPPLSPRRRAALAGTGLTAAVGVGTALAYTAPPEVYVPYMAAVLVAEAVVVARAVKRRMVGTGSANLWELVSPRDRRQRQRREKEARRRNAELRLLRDRLASGFFSDAAVRLEEIAADGKAPSASRAAAARALAEWRERPVPAVDPGVLADGHFDVLFVSNFNLGGGTTQSNRNEIEMLRAAGKRVGLIHHPLYQMHSARPISDKILSLVDGERVRLIEGAPKLSCDLLLMRFPPFASRLREDLPEIDAARKVLVVNQAPMTYYSLGTGHRPVWDVQTVHRSLRGWIGDHEWRTVGPLVHQALTDCHGKELGGVDLSPEHWYPSFDTAASQRRDESPMAAVARVGRHSRDHVSKWPELAADLRRAYPEREDVAIRVLGGADVPRRILGRLPRNWSATAFDSVDVGAFLRGLDCYVYFVNSTLLEAFGRAPVEAMAAGLPTILPPRFQPVFGDGALYAEPAEVAGIIDGLRADHDRYLKQRRIGIDTVERLFSHEAHRGRFRSLGIDLGGPRLRLRSGGLGGRRPFLGERERGGHLAAGGVDLGVVGVPHAGDVDEVLAGEDEVVLPLDLDVVDDLLAVAVDPVLAVHHRRVEVVDRDDLVQLLEVVGDDPGLAVVCGGVEVRVQQVRGDHDAVESAFGPGHEERVGDVVFGEEDLAVRARGVGGESRGRREGEFERGGRRGRLR
jgi:hypothetical protein